MPIEIREMKTAAQRRKFILFPDRLYKDNECYVPNLVFDESDTLNPKKNPAAGFCESALYMAFKDGEPVGRVAAIVNRKANEQWSHDEVRFGWFDFIDDPEVSKALIAKVEEFGRERGMKQIVGPLGFTDFDPEGMLVAGYDKLGTMALIYNHPYYVQHIEALGFRKEADWIEYKVTIPQELPEKIVRISKIAMERSNVHVKPLTKKIVRKENYGRKLFRMINECYKDLYNYTILPDDLSDKYLGFYLSVLDLRFVSMVENENDELVAFGITMPSLAHALQKSRGRMLPFGWWPIVKNLFIKHDEGLEMLLVGVRPDYRNTGINSIVFTDLFSRAGKAGFKWAETNAVLETNLKNQGQWQYFETECEKRRRSYIKEL